MALVPPVAQLALTLAVTLLLVAAPSTASIFPEDDYGTNYMAKRQINPDCHRCLTSFDSAFHGSCLRCWGARFGAVVPFHSKRSYVADDDAALDSYDGGQVDTFLRLARNTGCGCCINSRALNSFCCSLCQSSAKRLGKRSADHAPRPS